MYANRIATCRILISSAVDCSQHEEYMDKNRSIKIHISRREQFSSVVESHRLRETLLLPITIFSGGSESLYGGWWKMLTGRMTSKTAIQYVSNCIFICRMKKTTQNENFFGSALRYFEDCTRAVCLTQSRDMRHPSNPSGSSLVE